MMDEKIDFNQSENKGGDKFLVVLKQPEPTLQKGKKTNDTSEKTTIQSNGQNRNSLAESTNSRSVKNEDNLQGAGALSDGKYRDSSKMATDSGMHDYGVQKPFTLQKVWTEYIVRIIMGEKTIHQLDASKMISPPIMQFLYHFPNKEAEKRVQSQFCASFEENEMIITFQDDPLIPGKYTGKTLLHQIATLLEVEDFLEGTSMQFETPVLESIYSEIDSHPLDDGIAFYQGEDKNEIWIVGEREAVVNVKKQFNKIIKSVQKKTETDNLHRSVQKDVNPQNNARDNMSNIEEHFNQLSLNSNYKGDTGFTDKSSDFTESVKGKSPKDSFESRVDKLTSQLWQIFQTEFTSYFASQKPSVSVKLNPGKTGVIVKGLDDPDQYDYLFRQCFRTTLKFANGNKLDKMFLGLLLKPAVADYIDIQLSGMKCVWEISEDRIQVYGTNDTDVVNGVKIIHRCLKSLKLGKACKSNLEKVLESEQGTTLKGKLTIDKTADGYVIFGTDDVIGTILELKELEQFRQPRYETENSILQIPPSLQLEYIIENFSDRLHNVCGASRYQIKKTRKTDMNILELTGPTVEVKEAESKILKMIETLSLCEYVTGEESYKVFVKPEDGGKWLKSLEEKNKSKIGIFNGYKVKKQRFKDCGCWIRKLCHLHLVQGSITDIESDMILLPVNRNLEPCEIGNAMVKSGGYLLQEDLKQRKSKENGQKLRLGAVIFSHIVGDLPCQYVCYFVSEAKKSKFDKHIAEFMFEGILDFMNQKFLSTVAVPLQITGNNTESSIQCVKGLARSLSSFVDNNELHHMHFYLCMDVGIDTKKFQDELKKKMQDKEFRKLDMEVLQILEEKGPAESPIKLAVVEGSLMDENILGEGVMIINSIGVKLEFKTGFIAQQILDKGGESIKIECKQKFPEGLCYGEVVSTGPGNIKCEKICHVVLYPYWNEIGNISEKVLKCVVLKSLKEAERNKCTTVAFPGLGTGKLEYPYHRVAEIMIGCIDSYGRQTPSTCVREVKFVIWKNDKKIIQAFSNTLERQKYFMENEKFIELTPDIDTSLDWLEARLLKKSPLKIQLMPKKARRFEETKVVVFVDNSQNVQEKHINYAYKFDKDQYESHIAYTNDHDFKSQVEKCLNWVSAERLLSVSFDFAAKDQIDEASYMRLAQLMKGIILNHHVDYVNLVKIYIDVDKRFMDECCQSEKTDDSLVSKVLKGFSSLFGSDAHVVKWSKMTCDMRNHFLTNAVKISVVSENSESARQTMLEIQNKVKPLGQPKDKDKADKGKSILDKGKSFFDKGKSLLDKKSNGKKSGTTIISTTTNDSKDAAEGSVDGPELSFSTGTSRNISEVSVPSGTFEANANNSSRKNIICKVTAEVNPGFLKLDDEALKKIQDEINSKWNVELVIDREKRSMKLEGCNFEDVKKVNSYLENKVEEMNKSEYKRTDSIGSDFTGVDILKITPRDFDTLMYFWGDEYMGAHKDVKISYDGDQKIFVQCDQTESENLKLEINREIENIRKMTDTETIFEKSQIEKAKSCLQTLQSEFKEVYFFLDEDKLILHAVGDYNYTKKQTISHRAKLLTGQIKETKRGRRFAAGEDISVGQNDGHSGQDEYRSMPSSLPSHDSMRSSTRGQNRSTDEKKKFTTKEGIDIYVYSESILQLDVDCIVNAANERLGHGAGVAAVIARGAGYKLEEEGKEYIEQYGPIPVGECCHTTAGKLPYKYVIHTVGPRWNNSMAFKEQEQCKKELQSAIESCFYEADFLRMKSIGVPSVSAGIFGMPPYICAKQYLEAVLNYSQQRTWSSEPTTLKEIHFIDMNIEMCKQIADVFSKCGDFKEAGLSVGSKPSNISTSSRHSFSHSSYSRSLSNSSFDRNDDEAYSSSVEMLFCPCSWITIHLLQSSITDIKKVSAVVSPENLGFKHQGRISKAILDKADEDFRDKVEVLKGRPTSITSVFSVDCSKEMPWKCVLYSIAPRLDSKYKQNIQQFETDLKDTVVNILSEAAIKGLESLAIPLLGTAVTGTKTPMDSCCRSMLDGIWRMINKETRKKNWKLDLWIVTTDQDAINTFEKMLNTKTGSKLRNSNPDLGSSKLENQKTDGKTLDEDCCICMDKITDPKWLPCKHVFCKDCIDQQFTFKPACPQCGAVHGIVTGDQPPGRISIIKQYNSLPGYPECQTIAITYTFRSGYQSEEHPNPGQPYTGITRTGYLPDNEKGRLVAKLLQVAFDRRLVFTIGRSRTTGQEGVITWNDIHHKTRTYGGQQSFGYPDDTYLDRVLDELAAKGVTKDSINE